MTDSLPKLMPPTCLPPRERSSIYRMIDANGNRAREGIRVVEDYLRFACGDDFLSLSCKELRHELTAILSTLADDGHFLVSRSTQTDVGVGHRTQQEYHRQTLAEVAQVNLSRVAEALRTLEEVTKTLSPTHAAELERLRYRVYSLAKATEHGRRGRSRMGHRLLYVLVDLSYGREEVFMTRIRAVLDGGVDVIQLRDKSASDRDIIAAARTLRGLTQQRDVLLIVNDRPDIACLVEADGVHVGQEEMQIADVRSLVGPEMLIGVSAHNVSQARQALLEGSDYLGVGPVFPSQTKSFPAYVGLELVHEVCRELDTAAFAIGGINHENARQVVACGGRQIAVGHAIWHAKNPCDSAARLRSLLISDERQGS